LNEIPGEDDAPRPVRIGDEIEAEVSNIDSQDRRLTLSMHMGDVSREAAPPKQEKRESSRSAPKKVAEDAVVAKGGTIGELIKQKLGEKLALEKKEESEQ
jgi:small subunit ribosomal protein S1